jgi:hypothetical protein
MIVKNVQRAAICSLATICILIGGCEAKPNMPEPDRVLLSVSGGASPGAERKLIVDRDDIILFVAGNPKSFNSELDDEIKNKLSKLLIAYGYKLGSIEESDYVASYKYHIKSSGTMWEASSGYAPDDWKERGWFQNKVKGLHRYQLSLTLFTIPAKQYISAKSSGYEVKARSGNWFIDISGMVRTDNYKKPIDFGLVGGMRLFGRASMSYKNGPRVFSTDKDYKLLMSSDTSTPNELKQKSGGESIVQMDSNVLWEKFDELFVRSGVEVYEKKKERGYLNTSHIPFGTLKALGIADDDLKNMFDAVPEYEDGSYGKPNGYYATVRFKSIGQTKSLSNIELNAYAKSKDGKHKMRLISSDYVEPQLINYVQNQLVEE